MEKTLLYEAYATLSAAERREFGKFVRSPFFNQKPALVALCDYLCGCCERGEVPTAEGAWAASPPGPLPKKGEGERAAPLSTGEGPGERSVSPSPFLERGPGGEAKLRLANSNLLALLEH